jgi:hypothetical protein
MCCHGQKSFVLVYYVPGNKKTYGLFQQLAHADSNGHMVLQ